MSAQLNIETLQATVTPAETLQAVIISSETLKATLTQGPMLVTDCPDYEGNYEIRPAVEEQIFETAAKRMKKNLLVQEIPYMEVSNSSGGITATIG